MHYPVRRYNTLGLNLAGWISIDVKRGLEAWLAMKWWRLFGNEPTYLVGRYLIYNRMLCWVLRDTGLVPIQKQYMISSLYISGFNLAVWIQFLKNVLSRSPFDSSSPSLAMYHGYFAHWDYGKWEKEKTVRAHRGYKTEGGDLVEASISGKRERAYWMILT